ncbi:unnamed protein product [Paramecium sonneborni]|uniref:Uncharacterized protein n=1 Tax=Paramecium sonneborni TaxID=65129 RepID=A0A8S1RWK3_9CILI|nr:unnamed protein product [Paramecium sonneborni]
MRKEINSIKKQFSNFSGIIIQKFKLENELTVIDWREYVKNVFESYELCECQQNQNQKIQVQNINILKSLFHEKQNHDSFVLSEWVKIQEIINEDDQFIYPYIKLASNFEDPILSNDKLSLLQIQYKLSDIQNQIIVTTYSYIFPIVSKDFSNNPFCIVEIIDILHRIKLQHKIQVKLI